MPYSERLAANPQPPGLLHPPLPRSQASSSSSATSSTGLTSLPSSYSGDFYTKAFLESNSFSTIDPDFDKDEWKNEWVDTEPAAPDSKVQDVWQEVLPDAVFMDRLETRGISEWYKIQDYRKKLGIPPMTAPPRSPARAKTAWLPIHTCALPPGWVEDKDEDDTSMGCASNWEEEMMRSFNNETAAHTPVSFPAPPPANTPARAKFSALPVHSCEPGWEEYYSDEEDEYVKPGSDCEEKDDLLFSTVEEEEVPSVPPPASTPARAKFSKLPVHSCEPGWEEYYSDEEEGYAPDAEQDDDEKEEIETMKTRLKKAPSTIKNERALQFMERQMKMVKVYSNESSAGEDTPLMSGLTSIAENVEEGDGYQGGYEFGAEAMLERQLPTIEVVNAEESFLLQGSFLNSSNNHNLISPSTSFLEQPSFAYLDTPNKKDGLLSPSTSASLLPSSSTFAFLEQANNSFNINLLHGSPSFLDMPSFAYFDQDDHAITRDVNILNPSASFADGSSFFLEQADETRNVNLLNSSPSFLEQPSLAFLDNDDTVTSSNGTINLLGASSSLVVKPSQFILEPDDANSNTNLKNASSSLQKQPSTMFFGQPGVITTPEVIDDYGVDYDLGDDQMLEIPSQTPTINIISAVDESFLIQGAAFHIDMNLLVVAGGFLDNLPLWDSVPESVLEPSSSLDFFEQVDANRSNDNLLSSSPSFEEQDSLGYLDEEGIKWSVGLMSTSESFLNKSASLDFIAGVAFPSPPASPILSSSPIPHATSTDLIALSLSPPLPPKPTIYPTDSKWNSTLPPSDTVSSAGFTWSSSVDSISQIIMSPLLLDRPSSITSPAIFQQYQEHLQSPTTHDGRGSPIVSVSSFLFRSRRALPTSLLDQTLDVATLMRMEIAASLQSQAQSTFILEASSNMSTPVQSSPAHSLIGLGFTLESSSPSRTQAGVQPPPLPPRPLFPSPLGPLSTSTSISELSLSEYDQEQEYENHLTPSTTQLGLLSSTSLSSSLHVEAANTSFSSTLVCVSSPQTSEAEPIHTLEYFDIPYERVHTTLDAIVEVEEPDGYYMEQDESFASSASIYSTISSSRSTELGLLGLRGVVEHDLQSSSSLTQLQNVINATLNADATVLEEAGRELGDRQVSFDYIRSIEVEPPYAPSVNTNSTGGDDHTKYLSIAEHDSGVHTSEIVSSVVLAASMAPIHAKKHPAVPVKAHVPEATTVSSITTNLFAFERDPEGTQISLFKPSGRLSALASPNLDHLFLSPHESHFSDDGHKKSQPPSSAKLFPQSITTRHLYDGIKSNDATSESAPSAPSESTIKFNVIQASSLYPNLKPKELPYATGVPVFPASDSRPLDKSQSFDGFLKTVTAGSVQALSLSTLSNPTSEPLSIDPQQRGQSIQHSESVRSHSDIDAALKPSKSADSIGMGFPSELGPRPLRQRGISSHGSTEAAPNFVLTSEECLNLAKLAPASSPFLPSINHTPSVSQPRPAVNRVGLNSNLRPLSKLRKFAKRKLYDIPELPTPSPTGSSPRRVFSPLNGISMLSPRSIFGRSRSPKADSPHLQSFTLVTKPPNVNSGFDPVMKRISPPLIAHPQPMVQADSTSIPLNPTWHRFTAIMSRLSLSSSLASSKSPKERSTPFVEVTSPGIIEHSEAPRGLGIFRRASPASSPKDRSRPKSQGRGFRLLF